MTRTFSLCLLLALILSNQILFGAELTRRTANAGKAETAIRIDGKDDEASWKSAELLTGFTQYEPANGLPSAFTSQVRLLFDNYPDSISTELGKRDSDNDINADWFSIDLCPFDDGVNGFSFKLTVTGVQTDIKRASGAAGREVTWDAIWNAGTVITGVGWTAEIFIPFSSIRFP